MGEFIMNDDHLDLLDLDDNGSLDTLPDAAPFVAPRPKKPWLLLSVGLAVIVLATYIIIRTIGDETSSSMEVDLDAPVVAVVDDAGVPVDMNVMPAPKPVKIAVEPNLTLPLSTLSTRARGIDAAEVLPKRSIFVTTFSSEYPRRS